MSIIPLVASLIFNSFNFSYLELLPEAKFSFNASIIVNNLQDICGKDRLTELKLESRILKYKNISFNFNCDKKTLMKEVNPFAYFHASHSPKYEHYDWNASVAYSLDKNIELLISHQHWCQHLVDSKNEEEIKSYNLESIILAKNLFSQFQNSWQISLGKIINPRNYDSNYKFQTQIEIYRFFKNFYFSYQPSAEFSLTSVGQKLNEKAKVGLGIVNKKKNGLLEVYHQWDWPSGENEKNILGLILEIKI